MHSFRTQSFWILLNLPPQPIMMMRANFKKITYILFISSILLWVNPIQAAVIPLSGGGFEKIPVLIHPNHINEPLILDGEANKPAHSTQSSDQVSLEVFIKNVADGNKDEIRGVYSAGTMAFKVIQQPSNAPQFVSSVDGVVTQFSMPASHGVIGLLAHNYLSGEQFFALELGDLVQIIYGDGSARQYIVSEFQSYQALQPNSPNSRFVNLSTGEELSATQLFKKVYIGDNHVTLQTCIAQENVDSWGRMFVIAYPV